MLLAAFLSLFSVEVKKTHKDFFVRYTLRKKATLHFSGETFFGFSQIKAQEGQLMCFQHALSQDKASLCLSRKIQAGYLHFKDMTSNPCFSLLAHFHKCFCVLQSVGH